MTFAAIDIVFAGVLVLLTLRCSLRGFVSEVFSLGALALGLLTAILFFRAVAVVVRDRFMPDVATVPEIVAFVLLFLLVFIVARLVETILRGIIDGFGLGWLDRLLGTFLGIAEGLAVVCLLLFLIGIQPFFDGNAVLEGSFFARLLMPLIAGHRWELPRLPPVAWGM